MTSTGVKIGAGLLAVAAAFLIAAGCLLGIVGPRLAEAGGLSEDEIMVMAGIACLSAVLLFAVIGGLVLKNGMSQATGGVLEKSE